MSPAPRRRGRGKTEEYGRHAAESGLDPFTVMTRERSVALFKLSACAQLLIDGAPERPTNHLPDLECDAVPASKLAQNVGLRRSTTLDRGTSKTSRLREEPEDRTLRFLLVTV